jgi:hypothetical protein
MAKIRQSFKLLGCSGNTLTYGGVEPDVTPRKKETLNVATPMQALRTNSSNREVNNVTETTTEAKAALEPTPTVVVIGKMDSKPTPKYVVKLGWEADIHTISAQRLRFLEDELKMNVTDDPAKYLL